MSTNLLYLNDTYLFQTNASVILVDRDKRGPFILFDQTVFYPQGGGQQSDKGAIFAEPLTIPIAFSGFRDGYVLHYIPESLAPLVTPGMIFQQNLDHDRRRHNAQLHTAGHLVGHAFETLNPDLVAVKGHHFPNEAYVEFKKHKAVDKNALLNQANDIIAQAIKANLDVEATFSDLSIIEKTRPYLLSSIPRDKPCRLVAIGDYVPFPCGGTHVRTLKQVGMIFIKKINETKDVLRVTYDVAVPRTES